MTRYWLMKSEPSCFSIEALALRSQQTAPWDGVRNFQARNFMRDDMRLGDLAFFYHSSCTPPGIVGIMTIVREAYPDYTAWDPESDHPDPRSTTDNPLWFMVDVCLKQRIQPLLSLNQLKQYPALSHMTVLKRGNRLSITPVSPEEWRFIETLI